MPWKPSRSSRKTLVKGRFHLAKVLIIDDNDTLREGAEAVISRQGHEVFVAEGGEAGLRFLRAQPLDLVLTDLRMDGMDGLQVLKVVHDTDPDIAVVIMTAYGTIENAVTAIKRGAYDYVQKPFSPDALRLKVEQALGWRADQRRRAQLELVPRLPRHARV